MLLGNDMSRAQLQKPSPLLPPTQHLVFTGVPLHMCSFHLAVIEGPHHVEIFQSPVVFNNKQHVSCGLRI